MKKVIVLMGGESSEHVISLKTSTFIFHKLDRKKYLVKPVLITKSGEWIIPEGFHNDLIKISKVGDIAEIFANEFVTNFKISHRGSPQKEFLEAEAAVIGLHGGHGEDGTIQGLLASLNIAHTGSGVLASALAMDKEKANILFKASNFAVADFLDIKRKEYLNNIYSTLQSINLKYPIFVKPTTGGSSVGVGIAKNLDELESRINSIFAIDDRAILQETVKGIEVSCGVIEFFDNNKFTPRPLYPTEVIPKSEFFDYEAKYKAGGSEEITPARISEKLTEEVRSLAIKAHNLLGCTGYSRTDFIIQNEIPYILETNTLPGMTETSFIPQQVAYQKMDMSDILDLLIENGISKMRRGF